MTSADYLINITLAESDPAYAHDLSKLAYCRQVFDWLDHPDQYARIAAEAEDPTIMELWQALSDFASAVIEGDKAVIDPAGERVITLQRQAGDTWLMFYQLTDENGLTFIDYARILRESEKVNHART